MGFFKCYTTEIWTRWSLCNRVMECVQSVSFSVLINCHPHLSFSPRRGIRQGDPLSPYLFNLWAEVFSNLIRMAEESRGMRGVRIASGAPIVSHLLIFADDCIIFSGASEQEVDVVRYILVT